MQFKILNRFSGAVQFECELDASFESKPLGVQLGAAVKIAIGNKADLSKADLSWADLSWANLSKANLSKANLSEANLSKANLSEADLSWADLSWANLSKANLSEADLSWANLSKANLSEADLSWANLSKANLSEADLSWANLSKADLSWANLTKIRDDIWAVLSASPCEVPALRAALIEGRVDGSAYQGECACLVGTLANARHCDYESIPGLAPDSSRAAERFFMGIRKGDTPETNPVSKQVVEWIDLWLANVRQLTAV